MPSRSRWLCAARAGSPQRGQVVRAAAAEAAVTAAEKILTESVKGKVADDLLARGISDVKTKLN